MQTQRFPLPTRLLAAALTLTLGTTSVAQEQADVRLQLHANDPVARVALVDIQVRATGPISEFPADNQNYRFQFDAGVTGVIIEEELACSTFYTNQQGIFAFYDPHDLLGSAGNVVSYNVRRTSGSGGYPIGTEWVGIGRLRIATNPAGGDANLMMHDANTFPPTVVMTIDGLGFQSQVALNVMDLTFDTDVGYPVATYGAGCAGTGGLVPEIDSDPRAPLGSTFQIDLAQGFPNSAALLLIGTEIAPTPLPPVGACNLLVNNFALPVVPIDGTGAASFGLTIPNDPGVLGGLALQWASIDPVGPALGLAALSGGLRVEVTTE